MVFSESWSFSSQPLQLLESRDGGQRCGTGHPQPSTLNLHTSFPATIMEGIIPDCANCARVPFPGGNPSSAPWFVSLPLVVHEDVVEFSRSGSQGSDAAHLGPAAPCRSGWSWQGTSRDGGTVIMWPGAAWLSLFLLGAGVMRIWGIWGVWGGREVSAPLERVRCPVLAWQGRNKERRRGRMLPHAPGSPAPGLLLSIVFMDLSFIALHQCSGFYRQTKPEGDALGTTSPSTALTAPRPSQHCPTHPFPHWEGDGNIPLLHRQGMGTWQPGEHSSAPLTPHQGDAVEGWVGKSPIKIKSQETDY